MLKYDSDDENQSLKNKKQSFTLCIVLSLIGILDSDSLILWRIRSFAAMRILESIDNALPNFT